MKKILCWGLSLLLIAGLNPALASAESPENVIPDAVLRTAINRTLARTQAQVRADDAPITQAEMALLTGDGASAIDAAEDNDVFAMKGLCSDALPFLEEGALSTHDRGIRNLEGLQYAVNLKSLDLSENWIEDLSPLAELGTLEYLELDRNNISNLEPLKTRTGLLHLNLYNNNISDITPLEGLAGLQWFDLHFANRGQSHLPVAALAGMQALQYISIESNDLVNEDLLCLQALEHLSYIKLNANHLTDLTPIAPYIAACAADGSCRIEAINQTPVSAQTVTLQAEPAGGEVSADLPVIGGIESIFSSALMFEGGPSLSDTRAEDGISLGFAGDEEGNPKLSQAVLTFADRSFDKALDKADQLLLSYDLIDCETWLPLFSYMIALPVRLVQEAQYQTALSAVSKGAFVTMDTAGGETESALLTGSLNTVDGTPVMLERVESIQLCNGNNGRAFSTLAAKDIAVEGNQFSFRVEKVGESVGAWYVTPVIQFVRAGGSTAETIPAKMLTFHLYLGDAAAMAVDETVVFDLAKAGSDGTICSQPVKISLPGDTIRFATLEDKDRNELAKGTKGADGSYTFLLQSSRLAAVDHLYLNTGDTFLFPAVTATVIPLYTPSDSDSSSAAPAPKPLPDASKLYGDIPADHWATAAISAVVEKGLLDGTGEGAFGPDAALGRGGFVTALGRLAGIPEKQIVTWAQEQGIVLGTGAGVLELDAGLTREQLCLMMVRFAKTQKLVLTERADCAEFQDAQSVSPLARNAVDLARRAGLVSGKAGGVFDAKGLATRAESAVILARFLEQFPTV